MSYPFPYPTIDHNTHLKIAVDFGGVCSVHSERYETKEEGIEGINVPGCIETLTALKAAGHKLILLSFCGARRAKNTRDYLTEKHTGLFDELIFVKDRKYKSVICNRYGIDVLIDDRQDILSTVAPTQSILFTYENELAGKKTQAPKYMHIAKTWDDVPVILIRIKKLDLAPNNSINISKLCY